MCRVCLVETDSSTDRCSAHDGKMPSWSHVYEYVPGGLGGPLARLRGERCVIVDVWGESASVQFLDVGPLLRPVRSTVLRRDLHLVDRRMAPIGVAA